MIHVHVHRWCQTTMMVMNTAVLGWYVHAGEPSWSAATTWLLPAARLLLMRLLQAHRCQAAKCADSPSKSAMYCVAPLLRALITILRSVTTQKRRKQLSLRCTALPGIFPSRADMAYVVTCRRTDRPRDLHAAIHQAWCGGCTAPGGVVADGCRLWQEVGHHAGIDGLLPGHTARQQLLAAAIEASLQNRYEVLGRDAQDVRLAVGGTKCIQEQCQHRHPICTCSPAEGLNCPAYTPITCSGVTAPTIWTPGAVCTVMMRPYSAAAKVRKPCSPCAGPWQRLDRVEKKFCVNVRLNAGAVKRVCGLLCSVVSVIAAADVFKNAPVTTIRVDYTSP